MSLRHILIVDDDPALLQALPEALHLRIEGLAIDTADSGQAALERINERDYDAIISDIKMPGMDGLALLRAIRERRPETPTLLITGHGEHDLAVQALRAGAYDFIQKPIDRDYFVASLKRAIQVHQLKRQVEEQRLALERHASSLEETVQERTHKLLEANAAKDELLGRVEGLAELLRQRAVELDTIIESMADGVYVCDASGQVIRVNKSVTTLFGVTVEQAMAGNNPDAFRTLDGAPLPHEDYPLVQALRGVTRTDYRLMIRRADTGEDRQVRISAAPIRSSTGEITGAVAVASDITQVYQLERQKDDFLSIASHELKTPLTTMKVLTQLTQRQLERAGAPGSGHMARMAQSIARMEQLINDLLDASRIQAGKLAINLEPCALQPLCKQVAEDQMAATGRVIRLLAPEEPLVIEADVDRLSQVLTNLLSNALKYSPTTCPVTLTLEYTAEAIILSVRDEGPGIPAEALPHIFDRFYRAPGIEVQSGSGVGLGLGLHICREIVERHGGNIWAESTLGSGSVFYVALPVVPVLSQPAGFSGPEGAADRKRIGFSQER